MDCYTVPILNFNNKNRDNSIRNTIEIVLVVTIIMVPIIIILMLLQ